MLKLMKYEIRKQMLSKIIMAVILAALVIFFMVGAFKDSADIMAAATAIMVLTMVISVGYGAIEFTNVYEKDLNTKQSYMLFMVPHSARSILGAKILSAIVQIALILVSFGLAIGGCLSVFIVKNEGLKGLLEQLKVFAVGLFSIKLDITTLIQVFAVIAILWLFIVMLSIFITTAMNTVMNKNKLITFLSGIVYIVLFYLVFKVLIWICDLSLPDVAVDVLSYGYMIAIDIILFVGTAWLIEKKLSV